MGLYGNLAKTFADRERVVFLELALARSLRNTFAAGPQVLAEKNERLRSSSFLQRYVLFHV